MATGTGRRGLDWAKLLTDAVSRPGLISSAYSLFWRYSVGNQIWALVQCLLRPLEPGPLNTYRGWQKLGRQVRRGERAITLVMPVTLRRPSAAVPTPPETPPASVDAAGTPDGDHTYTRFIERPYWFVLAQTDGPPVPVEAVPAWDRERALATLNIELVPFHETDGNCQGYARFRQVAVSPIAFLPHRTLLHEIAHVQLGHTAEVAGLVDGDDRTPRDLREVEAESVALLCSASLGLTGEDFSRGYIQHWLKSEAIPERSVQRIFKAADAILRAGRPPDTADATDAIPG